MKIQSKITLLFIALSTGILLLLNAFILYFEYQFNFRDFFDRLDTRVNLTAQIRLFPNEKSIVYNDIRSKYLEKLDTETDIIFQVKKTENFKNNALPNEFFDLLVKDGFGRFRKKNKFYSGKIFETKTHKYIIVVSALNPYGLKEIDELQKILFFGFLGAVCISFFVGKAFSHYTFNPIRKLTEKVNIISSSNLHLRLDEPTGKDEVAELTNTFNSMLNRLETAFETQNNFVSNASHELRTPLTIINSELEYIIEKENLSEEQKQSLNTVYAESNKLIQILNSLLLLAQSGFNGQSQNWQSIRMDELTLLAVESVKKVQLDSNIQIDFSNLPEDDNQLTVSGNSNLLRLALSNIVSNACKYSNNRLVVVKLYAEKEKLIISVLDEGIGIPETELQHVFEPFFRASNTQEFMGHGVGLPLTLNILRLHHGTIGIRSEVNKGTEMQVILPIKKAEA